MSNVSISPVPPETPRQAEVPSPQPDSGFDSDSSASSLCPFCGPTLFRWLFEKEGRHFWRCGSCGLEKQHPLPSAAELQAYYENEFSGGMYEIFTSAEEMKTMTARRRLGELKPHLPFSGSWLDVGCANGVFVREAAALGMDASGVELSQVAVEQARQAGLDVRCGEIGDLPPDETFDCITGFDIIEHVLDPKAFLDAIVARLNPDAYVALTLPDKGSVFSRLMGSRWWFYIPEEHLHYFDRRLMRGLFEAAGLEPVHIGRTFKPLTYNYGLTQFVKYNPLIYRAMRIASAAIPRRFREWIVTVYIGEMMAIGRAPGS